MNRFLLGLLCAGFLFWGYDRWFAGDSDASIGGAAASGADPALGSSPALEDELVGHEVLRGAPKPELFMDMSLEEFFQAVDDGSDGARDSAWEVVARAGSEGRALLAQGLLERIRSAADPAAALALLGRRNGFLHTPEGRKGALLVAERLGEVEDAERVALGTELLEVCMRGSITRDQAQARAIVDEIFSEHSKAVHRHVFNPSNLTRAERYEVKRGDALSKIASRFSRQGHSLDAGTIALVNRIHNVNALRAGQVLKIPRDQIRTVVEKGTFLMAMYLGPDIVRLYWIGHGKDGCTPVATFTVGEKLKDPAWYAPGGEVFPHGHPENILGGFFVKFMHESWQGFAAHGTPQQDTICTESSMGCIRMRDGDIAEFFRIVPRGSEVEIRNTN